MGNNLSMLSTFSRHHPEFFVLMDKSEAEDVGHEVVGKDQGGV